MNSKSGKQKAESGMNAAASDCAHREHPASSNQHLAPSRRRALTLIELLVTIVIMVTVLAGVLPLVSPNNNARKLREASRQLNSLLSQAQAQAARDGRPVGVAFREFGTPGSYSGVALEAYVIAEPPPFAGFSEHSRVSVAKPRADDKLTYGKQEDGNVNGNGGKMFDARYRGYGMWELTFSLYGSEDPIPPRMVRNGDVINVDGNLFLIVDDDGTEGAHQIDPETKYVLPTSYLLAIWLNNDGQQLAVGAQKTYAFARQPVNTSDQPLQFPRGIAIDMEASGAEGISGLNPPDEFDALNGVPDTVGIMFSPNGSLEQLYLNGESRSGVEQVYLLMGLAENGNGNALDRNDYDFANNAAADAADMAARRSRVNWLNPDSRWVSVNRAGRIVTAENNISYDPNDSAFHNNGTISEQRDKQIAAARQLARNMSGSSGR